MSKRSNDKSKKDELRKKVIGLGERSVRKSYYPQLQEKIASLEEKRSFLEDKSAAMLNILEDLEEERNNAAQNEAWLNSIFATAPVGIVVLVDRVIITANNAMMRITGYSQEEMMGHSTRIFHGSDEYHEQIGWQLYNQFEDGDIATLEIELIRKDGQCRQVILNATKIDPDDPAKGVTVTVQDITKRKEAETQVRENQAYLYSVLNTAPAGIVVLADRLIRDVNEQYCKMLGYTREELIGQSIRFVYPTEEEYQQIGELVYLQIRDTGKARTEARMHTKDGRVIDILIIGTPIDPNDWSKGITFTTLDITERKRTEQEIQENRAYLYSVLNTAPMGIIVLTDRIVRDVNDQYCRMFGYTREELIGQSIRLIYPSDEEYERTGKFVYSQIRETGKGRCEASMQTKDGRILDVLITGEPIDASDWSKGITFALLDISERKQAERALNQRLKLEHLLSDISSGFIGLPTEETFEQINRSLQMIAEDLDFERLRLALITDDQKRIYLSEAYFIRDEELLFDSDDLDRDMPEYAEMLREKEIVWLSDLPDELPEESPLRQFVIEHGFISHLAIPMTVGVQHIGTLLITHTHQRIQFDQDMLNYLQLIAEVLANAIVRQHSREALAESEQRFRNILEAMPMGFDAYTLLPDDQLILSMTNPAAESILERDLTAQLGKSIEEVFPEVERSNLPQLYRKIAKGGGVYHMNNFDLPENQRPCGRYHDIYIFQPSPNMVAEMFLDVTEQLRIQRSLEFTQYATDHAVEGAFWLGEDGKLVYVNEAACRMLGYSREELLGLTISDLDPNFPKEKWPQHWEKSKKIGKSRFETLHRAKDGRLIPVEITSNFVEHEGKEYHCSFSRDITERKRMEENLIMREREFRTLAENSPDNIARYDTDCHTIYVNPALEKTLGRPASELLGPTPEESELIGQFWEYHEKIVRVLETGKEAEMDIVMADQGEGERYYNVRFVAERGADGAITGVLAVGRDVTERLQTQRTLQFTQFATDHAGEAVFWINSEARFIYVNDSACSILDYTRDELLTMSVPDIDVDLPPGKWAPLWQRLRQERFDRFEMHHQAKDGNIFPVEITANFLEYEGNEYICAFAHDITERKRYENAIGNFLQTVASKTGTEMFREFARQLAIQLKADMAVVGRIVQTDDGEMIETLAVYREGHIIENFSYPLAQAPCEQAIRTNSGLCVHTDNIAESFPDDIFLTKFGIRGYIGMPLTDRMGNPMGILCTLYRGPKEPTVFEEAILRVFGNQAVMELQRLQTQADLAESENKHRLLFTSANDAIFIMDQEYFVECNPRALELYGCESADQILGKSPIDFSPRFQEDGQPSTEKVEMLLNEAMAGTAPRFAWVHQRLDGELFYAEVALNKLVLGGRDLVQSVVRDVTERRVAEKAREKLLKELSGKNEELESIVYIASHDLRSPLVNIRGFSGELEKSIQHLKKLLISEPLSDKTRQQLEHLFEMDIPESLHFINSGNHKLDTLLNGLLRLSRIGAAQVSVARVKMDTLFAGILNNFQYKVREGQAQITVDPDLPSCLADEVLIGQVFTNLIDNAIKYHHPDRIAEVHVSAETRPETVVYCVADNGIGIAADHIKKIFEIFHRLHPMGDQPGEGLGLTIVRRILDRQDGKIWIESKVNVGTRVFVEIPKG